MNVPARVGLVGCGNVSRQYAQNAPAFAGSFAVVACADLDAACADAFGTAFGIPATTVDALLADPAVDVVLNLTPPSAHAAVTGAALAAGKHVYSEKPLAATAAEARPLLAEAARLGLRIGCAPDTHLGSAYQAARSLVDEGAIGEPLAATAAMLTGDRESWHPNPDIFFAAGAGPLLDMGPYYLAALVSLLGSVRSVAGFASTRRRERVIRIGPRAGERFDAATATHAAATLELDAGVTAQVLMSFDTSGQHVHELTVYGTDGLLSLPDPNAFAGPVRIRRGRDWDAVPLESPGPRDARGLGLHDLVEAIVAGRPHRASAELGLHVLEVAEGILEAAGKRRTVAVSAAVERPAPMRVA